MKSVGKKRLCIVSLVGIVMTLMIVVVGCTPIGDRKPEEVQTRITDDLYYTEPDESNMAGDEETGIDYVDNEVVVYCEPDHTIDDIKGVEGLEGASVVGHVEATNSFQVRLPHAESLSEIESLCSAIKSDDIVRECLPHYVNSFDSCSITGDPAWSEEPDAGKPSKTWGLSFIDVSGAWDVVNSDSSIHVGLLDSQFYTLHEDLENAFVETLPSTSDQFAITYVDEEGDEVIDVHGTHVAGIIGAESNAVGSVGVAYGSSLYGYSVGGRNSDGGKKITSSYGAEVGLTYLVDECGCDIINMSIGYGEKDQKIVRASETGEDAEKARSEILSVGRALSAIINALIAVGGHDGLLICKSAGNGGADGLAEWDCLGCIDDEKVKSHILIVGSVSMGESGSVAVSPFSSCGNRVDVLAPGDEIYNAVYETTGEGDASIPISGYRYLWGTSFAAPMVSGVAALVKAAYPQADGPEIRDIILTTAKGDYADATGVSKPAIDAAAAVRLAKARAGDGSYPAVDFVRAWYGDWTFDDGHKIDNADKAPDRVLSRIDGKSHVHSYFVSLGAGAQNEYSRTAPTCVIGDTTAEQVSDRCYRVTVRFVAAKEDIDQAKYDQMTANPTEDVWDVSLSPAGRVTELKKVSLGSAENNHGEENTKDDDREGDEGYALAGPFRIKYDLSGLQREGGTGDIGGGVYVPGTLAEYRSYFGDEGTILYDQYFGTGAISENMAVIPDSGLRIIYLDFGTGDEARTEAYGISGPLCALVENLPSDMRITVRDFAGKVQSSTGADAEGLIPGIEARGLEKCGSCYLYERIGAIYYADAGSRWVRELMLYPYTSGGINSSHYADLSTYSGVYQ